MGIDIVSIVLLAIVLLSVLVLLQVSLAARHDHIVALSGPRETRAQLDAQIQGKRDALNDLEQDLQKRREALANLANVQADVDALTRQRDELQSEWAQLDDRRTEVRNLRAETEQAWQESAEAVRELARQRDELQGIETKLQRAESLIARVDALTEEKERLASQVEALRGDAVALQEAREKAGRLREEIEALERETARLEGMQEAERRNLETLQAQGAVAGDALAKGRSDQTQLAAQVAAKAETLATVDEALRTLEARRARLEQEKEGGSKAGSDPLRELKAPPEVLRLLSGLREWKPQNEAEALENVTQRLTSAGLTYPDRVVWSFHTAMKVNETTQMAVLAGISGTGKSQLPRQYAAGIGIGFLQVPVQPRWDSPQDLMGFYNYIEGRYRPTDLARALYHLDSFNGPSESMPLRDRILLILLDEMNLARVEYYFSDFLSRLESRPRAGEEEQQQFRKDSEIELEIPMPGGAPAPRIFPGYNLLFAGTMNEDESTQSLSDKVVDRANVLRFSAPKRIAAPATLVQINETGALSRARWNSWLRRPEHLKANLSIVNEHIAKLADLMADLHRPFGHRLGIAIRAYAANYPSLGVGVDVRVPLADQVEMRLLPKLRGLDVHSAEAAITRLADHVRDELQDSVLAEAIKASLDESRVGTGSFVWRGVTRA